MFQLLHLFQFYFSTIYKKYADGVFMRIDKFLNSVNITKRRSVSQDMIANGVVLINGVVAKASKNIAVGDVITINYLNSVKKYKILQIPQTKSTPKSLQEEYIEEIL